MRWLLNSTVAIGAIACASCGNSAGLYPVMGKVLFNGEPAAGATVTFVRKGGADQMHEQIPQGVVQADGTFSLVGPSCEGCLPGEYVVLVEWKEGAGKTKGRAPALNAPDRFKKKYLDPNKTLLTAAVEAKPNALPPFEPK